MLTVVDREIRPLVPVTTTEYVPGIVLPTERLVGTCWLADSVTDPELSIADSPWDGESDRETVPENPAMLIRLMSCDACTPTWVLIDDGPVILKSTTLTLTTIVCIMDPEEAVTVTEKEPATADVIVRVEDTRPAEDNVMLLGLRLATPLCVEERVTTPLKPFTLVRVKVVELEESA